MHTFKLLIDGNLVDGNATIDVINPANEELVARCPTASVEQLEQAVAAAKEAYPAWRQTRIEERQAKLLQVADAIKKNARTVSRLLTSEQGKPLRQAEEEVGYAEIFCRYFATQKLTSKTLVEEEGQRVEIHRRPLGVVAGIIPWNFPVLIAVYKLAPALLAGNTLVLKPAPTTPLTALKLGELVKDIFPPGVVNVIADKNDLGSLLTAHPDIAKISFTGSTPTGKEVMRSASRTLKRLTLELGGNDAAIVLEDTDPKRVAESIFGAAFLNSGQVCIALKRLYVHERIYDEMCHEIACLAERAVIGDGMEPGTQFGPVQNSAQFEKVCDYIKDAKKNGRIIAGGDIPDGPGYFVPLTVVRDIEDGTRVVDEEPFGPILPIIKYNDLEDVIKRANTTPYGLGGSVWSGNVERALQIATRIESGTVWVNQHLAFGPNIPFPASKESGIGVEFGEAGLEEFTVMQVININKTLTDP